MLGERRACAQVYGGSFLLKSGAVHCAHFPISAPPARRGQRDRAGLRVGVPVLVAKYRLVSTA